MPDYGGHFLLTADSQTACFIAVTSAQWFRTKSGLKTKNFELCPSECSLDLPPTAEPNGSPH